MFALMSSTECNHQHCLHTFPVCVVDDQLQLCIHPCSDDLKRQAQQCCYCLLILIIYPEDILSQVQTTINHMGWDLENRMCQNLPAPMLHQILHIIMAMRRYIVLEQNDTMLK